MFDEGFAVFQRNTEYWNWRCAALDRHIDELVYELYGMTERDLAIQAADEQALLMHEFGMTPLVSPKK